jgi:hypothetical protein
MEHELGDTYFLLSNTVNVQTGGSHKIQDLYALNTRTGKRP